VSIEQGFIANEVEQQLLGATHLSASMGTRLKETFL
jgi:hypothetical protein